MLCTLSHCLQFDSALSCREELCVGSPYIMYVKSGRFRSQCEKSLGCRWRMHFSGAISLGRLA